ncbi:conjugal transfer protein TraF [Pseudomonas aeruginosa]|uniref:conjugal transfer protein TraF n=1 Tax=Pseudomonas aeruginosa TaxID=287 RepID=UPI0010484EC9|nr:conjugal transfer protein TraF [Pseudomonas aeruginosa]
MNPLAQNVLFSLALVLPLAVQAAGVSAQPDTPAAAASDSVSFYQGKADGWFWYKEPPEPPKEKKKKKEEPPPTPPLPKPIEQAKPVEPAPAAPQGPQVFSVAWLQKNLPKYRNIAIDNPTEENVQRYYYMQRMMMDKANKFAEVSSTVIMKDPFLDEDSRRPVATYAAMAMNREVGAKAEKVLKDLSKQVGLFFFFSSDCMLCSEQAGVLQALTYKTGIQVIPVSMDGGPLSNGMYPDYRVDQGQAKAMNIYQAPALALAIPPDKTEIVGYGAVTLDVLQNRIFMAARDAGVISKEVFASTQPFYDNGLLSMDDAQGLDEEMLEDPQVFVEHMRRQLAQKNIQGAK